MQTCAMCDWNLYNLESGVKAPQTPKRTHRLPLHFFLHVSVVKQSCRACDLHEEEY